MWDKIEALYQENKRELLFEEFFRKNKSPRAIADDLSKELGVRIRAQFVRAALAKLGFIEKVEGRYYKRSLKRAVLAYYRMTLKEFVDTFYFNKRMSSIEIQEMIGREVGINASRQIVWMWIYDVGKLARNHKAAFRLAMDKQRVDHRKIAAKIDYRAASLKRRLKRRPIAVSRGDIKQAATLAERLVRSPSEIMRPSEGRGETGTDRRHAQPTKTIHLHPLGVEEGIPEGHPPPGAQAECEGGGPERGQGATPAT